MRTLLNAGKMLCFAALIGLMGTALTTVFTFDAGPPGKISIAVQVLQPGKLIAQEVTAAQPDNEPGLWQRFLDANLVNQVIVALIAVGGTPLGARALGWLMSSCRIGWIAGRALKRSLDGNFSNDDKLQTVGDIFSVSKGWWPNKSALG